MFFAHSGGTKVAMLVHWFEAGTGRSDNYKISKTQRPTPASASNHTLTVMGDTILNVELNGSKGTL